MAESNGYSLGQGYIHATVSFDRIGHQIAKEMRKVTPKAGQEAGQRIGKAMREGVEKESAKVDLKSYEAHVKSVEDRVSKAVAASAEKQAAAKRKVDIAEAKLREAREKYKDGSSQLLAAEDRLAEAQIRQTRETENAEKAQRALNEELSDAKQSLGDARKAAEETAEAYKQSFGKKFVRRIHESLREAVSSQTAVVAAGVTGAAAGSVWGKAFKRALNTENIGKTVLSAFAGISGARVLGDIGGGFRDFVSNLDRSVPRIGLVSVALGGLSAAGIAAAGGLFGVINALGSIAAVGLTLPGMIGAGAASMAVFTMAMMDATTALADLGPMFQEIQDSVSGAFWARAADPILNLANAVFPVLMTRMTEVAHEMGGIATAIANTVNTGQGLAQLDQMFVWLRDAIDIAGDGVGAMTSGIMTLATVGSSYLPNLAGWFNDISYSFEAWVENAAASGEIFAWIETGITNLKALGSVLASTVGIFYQLGNAALEAGAGGLVGMASGLDRINTALSTELWQGRLVSMFSAAGASMDAVGRGLSAMGGGLINLGPTLNNVMVLSGLAIGELLKGFGAIMAHPAVGGGLQDMFEGLLAGVRNLAPAVAGIGPLVGGLMSTIGTLASTLGTVVASAVAAVGPALAGIMDGVRPVISALGEIVSAIIEGLAPVLQTVAGVVSGVLLPPLGRFAGWLADNTGMISGIATVIGVVATVLGTAALAVGAFNTVLAVLRGVMIGVNAVMAMNPFVLVAAAIAGLVTAVVLAYQRIGWFRDAVDAAWAGIKTAFSATISWITGTAFPGLMAAVRWVGDQFVWLYEYVVKPVWNWIKGAVAGVVTWFQTTVVPAFQEATDRVGGFFDFLYRNFIAPFVWAFRMAVLAVTAWFRDTVVPIFQAATDAIGKAFRWLNDNVIQPVWTWIKDAIAYFLAWFNSKRLELEARLHLLGRVFRVLYNEYVRPVWDWIRSKIDAVVRWFANTLVPWFRDRIQSVINKFNDFRAGVNTVWERVKTLLRDGWNWVDRNVFAKFRTGLDVLRDAFTKAKDGIGTAWDKLKAKVKEPITFVVNKVVNPFIDGYNKLNNFWSGDDLSKITGFHAGGYTGPGAKYKPAGVVHADEYVIRKESQNDLRRNAPGLLDSLNKHGSKALGYARGGRVGKRDDPAHAAPGARVYGGVGSFTNTLQHAIARMGELRVMGSAPGYSLPGAMSMLDGASSHVSLKRTNRMSPNTVNVGVESTPDWWGGYYSNYGVRLNSRIAGNMPAVQKRTLLSHELGHALGLPHSARMHGGNGARSIMNYDNMYQHNSVTAADVAALSAIYGGTGKASSPGAASGDDGNVWLDQLKDLVTKPIDLAKGAFPGNKFLQLPLGLADKLVEGVIDKAASLIGLGGGDSGSAGEGKVTEWMTTALKMKGLFSESNLASGVRRAMQESGGDPRAVNNWDSNAQNGDPSRGLMQTIGATFKQYMEPGHSDIFNAIDNILASINYTMARYGSLRAGWDRAGGYANGGLVKPGNVWDDPVGTVHRLSPGVSSIYNGTGGDEFFQRVTPGSGNPTYHIENFNALDTDDALRKLRRDERRREALANVG